jgi:hypothetical protein
MLVSIRGEKNPAIFFDHLTLEEELKDLLNEVFRWYP